MSVNKKKIPTFIAKDIYSIPLSFYFEHGYKIILTDLDNTLANYKTKLPDERTIALINTLKKEGFDVYIASNNTNKRVSDFASACGVESIHGMKKPFSHGLVRFIKEKGFNPKEVIYIGEQIYTDVLCANGAGVDVVLTEPITKKDAPWTRINRLREKKARKIIWENNLSERIGYEQN